MAKVETMLVGGKKIVDFDNRYCPICGTDMHQEMHCVTRCPKEQAAICHDHCFDYGKGKPCRYWSSTATGQYCKYWSKLKKKMSATKKSSKKEEKEQQKKVRRKNAGPSHR